MFLGLVAMVAACGVPPSSGVNTSTTCSEEDLRCEVDADCGCLAAEVCEYVVCNFEADGGHCRRGPLPQGAPCAGLPSKSCDGLGHCDGKAPFGCLAPAPDPAKEGCPSCDDDNACTEDVCEAGSCRHYYFGAGTLCGDGRICQIGWCCIH